MLTQKRLAVRLGYLCLLIGIMIALALAIKISRDASGFPKQITICLQVAPPLTTQCYGQTVKFDLNAYLIENLWVGVTLTVIVAFIIVGAVMILLGSKKQLKLEALRFCDYCGRKVEQPLAKFCDSCGSKMPLRCPKCHGPLPPNPNFCDMCGTKLEGFREYDDDTQVQRL
jgi:hypothetical protein